MKNGEVARLIDAAQRTVLEPILCKSRHVMGEILCRACTKAEGAQAPVARPAALCQAKNCAAAKPLQLAEYERAETLLSGLRRRPELGEGPRKRRSKRIKARQGLDAAWVVADPVATKNDRALASLTSPRSLSSQSL